MPCYLKSINIILYHLINSKCRHVDKVYFQAGVISQQHCYHLRKSYLIAPQALECLIFVLIPNTKLAVGFCTSFSSLVAMRSSFLILCSLLCCSLGSSTLFDDDLRELTEFLRLQMRCGYPERGIPVLAPVQMAFKAIDIRTDSLG